MSRRFLMSLILLAPLPAIAADETPARHAAIDVPVRSVEPPSVATENAPPAHYGRESGPAPLSSRAAPPSSSSPSAPPAFGDVR